MLRKLIILSIFLSIHSMAQIDVNNRFMLANAYEQAGDFEKARDILEELHSSQPGNFQFFETLNRVYLQLKNYEASEALIKKRISGFPQDINLYGMLGKTYYTKGDEQKAFSTWDEAINKSNFNLISIRVIANYAIECRAFNKAIDVLQEAKKRSPDAKLYSYDLANLYSITMNYTAAAEEYVSVLKSAPNEFHTIRGRLNSYINKPEALKQTIKVFEKDKRESQGIKSMLAWLYTEDKDFTPAYVLYKELDEERGAAGGEIFGFAQYLFNMKEYEAASAVFLDIINGNSSSPLLNSAKMSYARSMEELLDKKSSGYAGEWKPVHPVGEINSAEADRLIEIYLELSQKPVGNDVSSEALFRAGKMYLNYKNKPDQAKEIFNKILNSPVSLFSAPASIELGQILLKEGKLQDAMDILGKVSRLPRSTVEQKNRAKFLIAESHFYRQEFNQAGEIISQILKDLKDNSANDALELSLVLNIKMNDSLSLVTFSEAEFLLIRGQYSNALDKYSSISAEKAGFVIGSLAELRRAETELAMDNTDDAVRILSEITTDDSKNIYSDKALYLLGNIYEFSLQDSVKAMEIYEKLLARFPSSMYLEGARERIIELRKKLS